MTQKDNIPIISNGIFEELSKIPFHESIDFLKRIIFPEIDNVHLAVHIIENARARNEEYAQPHTHDVPELNLILSQDDELEYRINFDGKEQIVKSPSALWIPAGVEHSANAIRGSGIYMCLVFSKGYQAFKQG